MTNWFANNGHTHPGKPHHQCRAGGGQFVNCFAQDLVSHDTRALIERLQGERISWPGSWRAVGVLLKGLSGFLVHGVDALPDHLHVQPATCQGNVTMRPLEVEADAMHSVVQQKGTKPWIWIAMDAKTRQVVAFHGGDRSRKGATQLWAKIPDMYRQRATFHTDQYAVYKGVIPAAQHRAISELACKTNHSERFNYTRRQRVSRLVREALSISKKLVNQIGAINMFIWHDNLVKAAV